MAFTTLHMGLTAWDLPDDKYDHFQLTNNFNLLDQHRHIAGEGLPIPSGGLEDNAITAAKIAANSVTADKIPDNSLSGSKLIDDAIANRHLQNDSVTSAEILDGSVGLPELNSSIIPLGTLRLWWRPNTSVAVPTGTWEVCDGRPWSSIPNGWGLSSGNMPDFRNRVPLGAALSGVGSGPTDPPDVGQIGGSFSWDLTHSHTVNSHSHTVSDHAHGISNDGAHSHTVAGGTNIAVVDHGRFDGNYTFKDTSNNNHDTSFSLAYVTGYSGPGSAPIDGVGNHSHGGQTGGSGTLTSSSSSPGTNNGLGVVNQKPNYVGVLVLMRVL